MRQATLNAIANPHGGVLLAKMKQGLSYF